MDTKKLLRNLDNVEKLQENIKLALITKAVEKLEERKINISKNYFGQK